MSLNTNPDSPRQKMINLMYIVLMAMLALNVSSDVLNGFSLVDESLSRTTANSTVQNQSLYDGLAGANERRPASYHLSKTDTRTLQFQSR